MSDSDGDGDVKMTEGGKKDSKKNKVFENKNTVSKTKHENKRSQKEALKKIKTKRQAGTKIEAKVPESKIWA